MFRNATLGLTYYILDRKCNSFLNDEFNIIPLSEMQLFLRMLFN